MAYFMNNKVSKPIPNLSSKYHGTSQKASVVQDIHGTQYSVIEPGIQ